MEIKPIPYYTLTDDEVSEQCADELRAIFVPKITSRFPMNAIGGLKPDAIISRVAKYKKTHPCYLRTDINKYYPSVSAKALLTQVQYAWKELHGLKFMPNSFKERFFERCSRWVKSLPHEIGIPLGSAMSLIMSQVGLVPIWLEIVRRHRGVEIIVKMDDILIMCPDAGVVRDVWNMLQRLLHHNLNVYLNVNKTKTGRLGTDPVEFCGWHFAGGYVVICEDKCNKFRDGIVEESKANAKSDTREFIKHINHRVDGFGNHYKYGNVLRQFEELDKFVRTNVRSWMAGNSKTKAWSNKALTDLGLHSLVNFYYSEHEKRPTNNPTPPPKDTFYQRKPAAPDYGAINTIAQNSVQILTALGKIIEAENETNNLLRCLLLPMGYVPPVSGKKQKKHELSMFLPKP